MWVVCLSRITHQYHEFDCLWYGTACIPWAKFKVWTSKEIAKPFYKLGSCPSFNMTTCSVYILLSYENIHCCRCIVILKEPHAASPYKIAFMTFLLVKLISDDKCYTANFRWHLCESSHHLIDLFLFSCTAHTKWNYLSRWKAHLYSTSWK